MDGPKTHTWEAYKQGMLRCGASFLARAATWEVSLRRQTGAPSRRSPSFGDGEVYSTALLAKLAWCSLPSFAMAWLHGLRDTQAVFKVFKP